MISQDDIDAMASDLEIADQIVERAKRGVTSGREIMASETLPFIRAFVLLRGQLEQAASFMSDQKERENAGMAVGTNTAER